jgi:hypothetical protein
MNNIGYYKLIGKDFNFIVKDQKIFTLGRKHENNSNSTNFFALAVDKSISKQHLIIGWDSNMKWHIHVPGKKGCWVDNQFLEYRERARLDWVTIDLIGESPKFKIQIGDVIFFIVFPLIS